MLFCGLGWGTAFFNMPLEKLGFEAQYQFGVGLIQFHSQKDLKAAKITNELDRFNIASHYHRPVLAKSIIKLLGMNREYLSKTKHVFKEKVWGFDPDVLSLPDEVYLMGLFQSYKYFEDFEETIFNDLQFTYMPKDKQTSKIEDHINSVNSVSVHVRRGDYLRSSPHNVCNERYYFNAISYAINHLDSAFFSSFQMTLSGVKLT